jgi:hypothetical protein
MCNRLATLMTALREREQRLAFTPRSDGVESWYEFAAQGTLEKFFEGVPPIKAVVPVRGFEPRFDG